MDGYTITLHTGRKIPVIGLGTWKLTRDTNERIQAALDLGYRLIDTSGDYETQKGIGEAIQRSGIDRTELFITTKVEEDENAYQAVQKNLDELRIAYADLVLIHRPPKSGAGTELWQGLIRAQADGLAKDIGVSNYAPESINELIRETGHVPVVNQIEWSPFGHSEEMFRFAREHDMLIQAYSPLTRGKRLDDKRLAAIAKKYKKSPAQIIIRWNIQSQVVPVPKASSVDHMKENIDVFGFEISYQDMITLSSCNEQYSALGGLAYI